MVTDASTCYIDWTLRWIWLQRVLTKRPSFTLRCTSHNCLPAFMKMIEFVRPSNMEGTSGRVELGRIISEVENRFGKDRFMKNRLGGNRYGTDRLDLSMPVFD